MPGHWLKELVEDRRLHGEVWYELDRDGGFGDHAAADAEAARLIQDTVALAVEAVSLVAGGYEDAESGERAGVRMVLQMITHYLSPEAA